MAGAENAREFDLYVFWLRRASEIPALRIENKVMMRVG